MIDGVNVGVMGEDADTAAARLSLRGSVSRPSVTMVSSPGRSSSLSQSTDIKYVEMVTYMKVSDAELRLRSRCH